MATNKVEFNNKTLIDLTQDTVTPNTLLAGATAHSANGEQINGAVVVSEITLLDVYPVGSIYISVSDANPSTLFGGTWVRLGVGRTLISAGGGTDPVVDSNNQTNRGSYTGDTSWFPVGETGGEPDHTLTANEMPKHSHGVYAFRYKGGANDKNAGNAAGNWTQTWADSDTTGGNGSHNNIQPYLAVYMWKRTA